MCPILKIIAISPASSMTIAFKSVNKNDVIVVINIAPIVKIILNNSLAVT